ncbi:hypothetical protein ACFQX6_32575 [Streptosporangium lutulentum]
MRGLRARLVIVCVLLAGLSALTAAGLIYRQARDLMLTRTEGSVVNEFRLRVATLTENMQHPPDRAALQQLANGVAPSFLEATGAAAYRDSGLVASGDDLGPITPRCAVRSSSGTACSTSASSGPAPRTSWSARR